MKKTLGALALLGASALVLAGCAGGDAGSASDGRSEGAEIRVWLVGTDTPQEARDYLKTTFEDENPGSTLVIEEQTWEGLVDKLTTSLSSSDSPDIVEFGNTQAPAFTSVGALLDLTDMYDDARRRRPASRLRRGRLVRGRVLRAPRSTPGARVVFADPALVAEAPADLDAYIASAKELAAANPGKSGIYFAGQDWYNALPFIWENGGEVAVADGDTWDAQLSSPESVKGLLQVQDLMVNASRRTEGRRQRRAVDPVLRGLRHPVLGAQLGAGPRERVRDREPAGRARSSTPSRA